MKRELFKRRGLYSGAFVAWVVSVPLIHRAIETDASDDRVLMIVGLIVASTLTLASLLVALLPPLERAYRVGYEAGQKSTGCSAFRPILTAVEGQRGGGTVTKLRVLHTDN